MLRNRGCSERLGRAASGERGESGWCEMLLRCCYEAAASIWVCFRLPFRLAEMRGQSRQVQMTATSLAFPTCCSALISPLHPWILAALTVDICAAGQRPRKKGCLVRPSRDGLDIAAGRRAVRAFLVSMRVSRSSSVEVDAAGEWGAVPCCCCGGPIAVKPGRERGGVRR